MAQPVAKKIKTINLAGRTISMIARMERRRNNRILHAKFLGRERACFHSFDISMFSRKLVLSVVNRSFGDVAKTKTESYVINLTKK
jgi:hypothetical protein